MPSINARSAIVCIMCVFGVSSARGAVMIFDVTPSQSNVTVTVALGTPIGSDTASDTSSLTGVVIGVADSADAPFSEFQIVDMDVSTGNATALNFCLVELFGCLAGVDVTAAAGDISVLLDSPGAPAPVVAGDFTQLANGLKLVGNINVDATGLADGQVPEGPFILDSDPIANDLSGTISQDGSDYDLTIDLLAQGLIDDPDTGVTTDFTMTGTVVASGTLVEPGDLDCSGTVDMDDLPHLVEALVSPDTFSGCAIALADVDEDGFADGADIGAFVQSLLSN